MKILVVFVSVVSLLTPSLSFAEPAAPSVPVPPLVVMAPPADTGSAAEAATKAAPKPLPPPTPERLALARQVIEAQGGAKGFSEIFNAGIDGIVEGLKPGPEVLAMVAPYRERLKASLTAHMPEIVEAAAKAWGRTYTEQELQGQLDYLRSPTARSVLAKWPRMAGQMGQEAGWFIRQVLLTDPSMSRYLADATTGEEQPPRWPTPPPEALAIIKTRLAASPAGDLINHPDRVTKQILKGRKGTPAEKKMYRRMAAILPACLDGILAIIANNTTPDELRAQDAYLASAAGKAQVAKAGQVSDSIQADLKPILIAIFTDLKKTPAKT